MSLSAIADKRHLALAGVILACTILAVLQLFQTFWRRSPLGTIDDQPGGWLGVLLVIVVSAVVHEGIHMIGWSAFGGVSLKTIRVRPTHRGLGLAAHLETPISMAAYRAGLAMPALVLGVLPVALGLVSGLGLCVLWGLFFLFECITDIALLVATRTVPAEARVVSHPTKLGCSLT